MTQEPVLSCYYCENPAEAECPTCGRLYCGDHGEDVCLRCLSPESAVPSAAIYRGSVLALVIASLVTLFLLVRPPESKSASNLVRDLPTSTAAVIATATPTRQGGAATGTPRQGTQVPSSVTPSPSTGPTTPSPNATATGRTYVMKPGDTLSAVAASFGVSVDELVAANPGLNPNSIPAGTEIKIP
jgi:LysM repeat protein